MLDRFRALGLSVIRRRNVLKALGAPTTPLLSDGTAAGAAQQRPEVSMEYLSKLQSEYTALLNKINSVTDKLNAHSRDHKSLWASLAVEEYFDLIFRAHGAYAKLVPYWDPAKLPSFGWHWTHRVVRTKSLNRIVELPNLLAFAKGLRGQKAGILLGLLQEELDDYWETSNRSAILALLHNLSDASGELPATYWLTDVKRSTRRAYGGDAEVWVGSYAGQEVAVRDFWFPSEMSPERLQKVIRREIISNRQLTHANILRLIGVFNEESRPMSVVTPWMANGVALTYLELHPVELLHIVRGVVDGIRYLHERDPPVIHGEIHPRNILVNADGDAVIRDLGITRVRMEVVQSLDERIAGFSPRYQAPEVMAPRKTISSGAITCTTSDTIPTTSDPASPPFIEDSITTSFATDCYALAMTLYHLVTRVQPFSPTFTTPTDVLRAVLAGERPALPPPVEQRVSGAYGNIYDADLALLWGLLGEMWSADPAKRPSMEEVQSRIVKLENREPCQGCADLHRGRECIRTADDAPCRECNIRNIKCVERIEDLPGAQGYGIDVIGRTRAEDGYYVTALELPPSPEGQLTPGGSQILETRRIRLVPFTWQRRRRTSSARTSPPA